ncbi:DNA-(apurinic or apyrimidinic site) endonuclease 2 isoform X3 [Ascaphus truei]
MRVVSWNINGIRATRGGLQEILDSLDADIICLQETKVTRDLLDEPTAIVEGYNSYFCFSRARSGYSGVATFCKSRTTPWAAEEGLSGLLTNHRGSVGCYGNTEGFVDEELQSLDQEGRAVLTQHHILTSEDREETLTVINVYCPRADPEKPERKSYKLRFYRLLQIRAEAILQAGGHVIVLGDVNTSHRPLDHCDPTDLLGAMTALLLLAAAACLLQASFAFKIASFNIQNFGISKVTDPDILGILIQILRRYDLVSIQEVRSSNDTAITRLVQELNAATGLHYNVLISDHLGRSSYREKYAYIYREDILKPTQWYHYDDGCENCGTDTFIREPFVARFASLTTELKDFTLASIHTSPDYAVREVDALYDVWEDAKQRALTEDILILGDYNADCNYVKDKHWPSIRLRHAGGLQWLIGDEIDTTVSTNTHCAYDRLVASGAEMQRAVLPGTAKAFNYQEAYGLTYDMAKAVSDHYPVELELRVDPFYNGQRFAVSSAVGINGGVSLNGLCDCVGVDFTSCQARCGAYSKSFPCNCNAACGQYDSCCADYKSYCMV